MQRPTSHRVPPTRAGAMARLFTAAALMNAAMATASAVSTIVAAERLSPAWGGAPNAAGIVGTGIGALVVSRLMRRRGRRAGLVLGYLVAAAGGLVSAASAAAGDVPALAAGMLMLGLGNASAQLSRYAAADLYPAPRRPRAISVVVSAGAIGAIGGPLLLSPSSDAASALGWTSFVGPFLFAALASGLASAALTRAPTAAAPAKTATMRLRDLRRTVSAGPALAVMATAHVVMVAVMTAAPLHLHTHGHGLGAVGVALAAHTFGMFALSPLTARLLTAVGSRTAALGGLGLLALASALAALSAAGQGALLTVSLLLLGYGWNVCFISGSSELAQGLPDAQRPHVEGAVDAAVWSLAATASVASTVVLAYGGYATLAISAGLLVVLPAAIVIRMGRRPAPADQDRPVVAEMMDR